VGWWWGVGCVFFFVIVRFGLGGKCERERWW